MFNQKTGYILGDASRFWWLILAAGIFAFISPYVTYVPVPPSRVLMVGGAGVFIGFGMRLNYYGLQIDTVNKRMRDYTSIFGIKKGKWEALPVINKVVLTAEEVSNWNTPNGVSPTFKTLGITYTVGLFNDSTLQLFFQTEDKREATSQSEDLARLLEVPLELKIDIDD